MKIFRKCWDRADIEVIIIIESWFLRSRIYLNQEIGHHKAKKQTTTKLRLSVVGINDRGKGL